MSDDNNIEKATISLKTTVIIIVAILTYAASLMIVYFKMQAKVEAAQNIAIDALTRVKAVDDRLNNSNIAVLKFQVDEISISVKELSKNVNDVKDLLRHR